jgi:hypothetical protein
LKINRREWRNWLWRRRWRIGLAAALLMGAAFRLIWLSDMEYKADEAWTFERVKAFLQTGEAPAIGMMSSAGVPNAGLSIWLFLALGYITHALTPLALARAVQIANVVALLLLAVFALQMVSRREREPWLWATALVAVNPLSVLFSRKIWPPDLFPLFTLGFLTAWWRRSSWIGAFCWGLIGALLGQIQLCGFLFAASFALVTLIYDRRSVDWPAWFTGSVMGIAPMVPWLNLLLHDAAGTSKMTLWPPKLRFLAFFLYWPGFATGLDLPYALGHDFLRFLASPFIGSVPTCLSGIVFAAAVVLWARLIVGFVFRAKAGGARAPSVGANAFGVGAGRLVRDLQPVVHPRRRQGSFALYDHCLSAAGVEHDLVGGCRSAEAATVAAGLFDAGHGDADDAVPGLHPQCGIYPGGLPRAVSRHANPRRPLKLGRVMSGRGDRFRISKPNRSKMPSGPFAIRARHSSLRLSVGFWEDSAMTPISKPRTSAADRELMQRPSWCVCRHPRSLHSMAGSPISPSPARVALRLSGVYSRTRWRRRASRAGVDRVSSSSPRTAAGQGWG